MQLNGAYGYYTLYVLSYYKLPNCFSSFPNTRVQNPPKSPIGGNKVITKTTLENWLLRKYILNWPIPFLEVHYYFWKLKLKDTISKTLRTYY